MLRSIRSLGAFSNPAVLVWLERKCNATHAQDLAGHWAYDLALHRTPLIVLEAERVALPATESLLVFPDRRRLRAA